MSNKKARSTRLWIGSGLLLIILSCSIPALAIHQAFSGLPGALETGIDIDQLTQVVVPGSAAISFEQAGARAVYYEHRSAVNGVQFTTDPEPPDLMCTLTAHASGNIIQTVPDYVESNVYWTQEHERSGRQIMSLTVPESGLYTFECQYSDGQQQPQIVLAVGPNFFWEFFNSLARLGLPCLGGMAGFAVAVGLTLLIATVALVRPRALSAQSDPEIHT